MTHADPLSVFNSLPNPSFRRKKLRQVFALGPWCIYYSFQFSRFMGLLGVWKSGLLFFLSSLGALFLLLLCLVQFWCEDFYLLYFVTFGCNLLETSCFLMRNKHTKRLDQDGRDVRRTGKSRGMGTIIRIYLMRIEFTFDKCWLGKA